MEIRQARTRTLVIGVRKDIKEITPCDVFPDKQPERTLRQVIGHLPSLKKMGEISENDIYHNFRKYNPKMEHGFLKLMRDNLHSTIQTLIVFHTPLKTVLLYIMHKRMAINILDNIGIK